MKLPGSIPWLILAIQGPLFGDVIRVPEDRPTIQAAIDRASAGDEVLVGPGAWEVRAPIDFLGKDISLISTSGPEETTIRMAEEPDDPARASVITFAGGETAAARLAGFTITGGKGSRWGEEVFQQHGGGGILCLAGSSPTIRDCSIEVNLSDAGGGALAASGAAPGFIDCRLIDNTASLLGGAVACFGASPTFRSCRLARNFVGTGSSVAGGGIFGRGASPVLEDCEVLENVTYNDSTIGGGAAFEAGSNPTFRRCTVAANAAVWGGGISLDASSGGVFSRCAIRGNWALAGGGMHCAGGSSPSLEDCLFEGNGSVGERGGGGLRCASGSSPRLERCVFTGNDAERGGALMCSESAPTLVNCLITGNAARLGGGGLQCSSGSSATALHCTITGNISRQEGGGGIGCLDSNPVAVNSIIWGNSPDGVCGDTASSWTGPDPLFVNRGEFDFTRTMAFRPVNLLLSLPDFIVESGDYRLQAGSGALGAARPDAAPEVDILGNRRDCKPAIDMGAYASCSAVDFRRGDADASGEVDITDSIHTLQVLFLGIGSLGCGDAADADDSGVLDISDPIFILRRLFLGEEPPPPPGPDSCGPDPAAGAPDALGCDRYAASCN